MALSFPSYLQMNKVFIRIEKGKKKRETLFLENFSLARPDWNKLFIVIWSADMNALRFMMYLFWLLWYSFSFFSEYIFVNAWHHCLVWIICWWECSVYDSDKLWPLHVQLNCLTDSQVFRIVIVIKELMSCLSQQSARRCFTIKINVEISYSITSGNCYIRARYFNYYSTVSVFTLSEMMHNISSLYSSSFLVIHSLRSLRQSLRSFAVAAQCGTTVLE